MNEDLASSSVEQAEIQARNDLALFFGDNVKIQPVLREKGSEYIIDSFLEDGVCEGGQYIKARILSKQNIPVSDLVKETFPTRQIRGYRIVNLSVNGDSLMDENDNAYLVTAFPEDDQDKKEYNSDGFFSGLVNGPFYDPVNKIIILTRIQSGDDLAFYFHEKGHNLDNEMNEEHGINVKKLQKIINGNMGEFANMPEAVDLWRYVVEKELIADKNALNYIQTRRNAAWNSGFCDPFPKDEGLFRVQKLYTTLLLQNCISLANGAFRNTLTNDELDKMLDFGFQNEV